MATERGRALARSIAAAIGRRPKVHAWSADHFPGLSVAVLLASGWPTPDLDTAITLDLSDDPLPGRPIQYELYVVARRGWNVEGVLGDVGIRVRRGTAVPEPGEFVLNGMSPSHDDLVVRHLYAIDPPTAPLPIDIPDTDPPIGLLQLVPFTEQERLVLERGGRDRLVAELQQRGEDLLDWSRA